MSWTDQELSEMAKKAEAGHAFTYDDSFWGEMEALLPTKKKSIWPYFLAIVVPVVGAVTLFFAWPSKGVSTSHVAKTIPFEVHRFGNTNNFNLSSFQGKKVVESVSYNGSQNVSHPQSSYSVEKTSAEISNVTEINSKTATQEVIKTTEHEIVERLPFSPLSLLDFNQDLKMSALPYYSKRRFFSTFGELGFGIGETYRADQIGHTESISLSAGVRLTKNKLFGQAGLGFEVEKASLELSQREKTYNYSVNTYENRLSYKQGYRLNMPINFGYQIAKHTLQIGATPSCLLSTKMKYAYLENENVKRNETIFGTKTGWKTFGLKLNLGYGFNLFPSTTLGVNFQIQLMNQLDRSWTTNENKMPISGQVFIRKTVR